MAKHEKKMARKSGGEIDNAKKPDEEVEEEAKEAEDKHADGGSVQARKRGGAISGKKPSNRPDKRARGGATSDNDPLTSAGKMSSLPFERVGAKPDGGGKGMDRG